MLNKLLLDLQRDLKPSVIGMTTKCMMTIYHIGNMIVMNDCLTCVASFSDHLLSMYVLKFSRQQRKGDRITSEPIKLFSKDLICLSPLQ